MSLEELTGLDPTALRGVLGYFVTGVVVITTEDDRGPVGLTANSFTSVSLQPPLVLFCVHQSSRVRQSLDDSSFVGVNILGEEQEPVSRQFAAPWDDRFTGMAVHTGNTGAPLLSDALAHLECEVEKQVDAGDHVIVLARVHHLGVRSEGRRPLTFFGGRYGRLHDDARWPD
ncbi:MAG: flavin reductase family protein [Pseudonocardiaceae bacterium]